MELGNKTSYILGLATLIPLATCEAASQYFKGKDKGREESRVKAALEIDEINSDCQNSLERVSQMNLGRIQTLEDELQRMRAENATLSEGLSAEGTHSWVVEKEAASLRAAVEECVKTPKKCRKISEELKLSK